MRYFLWYFMCVGIKSILNLFYFQFNFRLDWSATLSGARSRTRCPALAVPVSCCLRSTSTSWRPGVNYSCATCAPSCLLVTTSVTLFRTVRHRRCCRFYLCWQRLLRCLYIFNANVGSAVHADGGVVVVVVVVVVAVVVTLPTPKRLLLLVCFQFCCWWAAID